MILTITMNASIDMSYHIDGEFKLDDVNRVQKVSKTAGGKGLNVTRVLHQMGRDVKASGLVAGNFGRFITDQLTEQNIQHDFFEVEGETRNSIAILHEGNQTEILENGPTVSEAAFSEFLQKFDNLLNDASLVAASGSLPKGLPTNTYAELIQRASKQNIPFILDTSGDALVEGVRGKYKPLLIKPNESEIAALVGENVAHASPEKIKELLQDLIFADIHWVVVSLGAQGAVVKHQNDFYKADIPTIEVVNPVGSGDSTIAGFAMAISEDQDTESTIKAGMTLGMLNTMEAQTGHVNPQNYQSIFDQIHIRKI